MDDAAPAPGNDVDALLGALERCDVARDHLEAVTAAGLTSRLVAMHAIESNRLIPGGVYVETLHGPSMFVNVRDYIGRELFLHRAHEPRLSSFLARTLKPGGVFVDVGAHFGYFSQLAARLVGPEGRVLAVEPAPDTLNYLRMNVGRLKQVEVVASAAWNRYEVLHLKDYGQSWSCLNTVVSLRWARDDIPPPPPVAEIRVPGEPLDSVLGKRGLVPDVVKIDAESAEYEVLEGLAQVIAEHRPILVFEAGDVANALEQGARTSLELISYVASLGYAVHPIGAGGVLEPARAPDAFDDVAYQNLVGVPLAAATARQDGGPQGADATEGEQP